MAKRARESHDHLSCHQTANGKGVYKSVGDILWDIQFLLKRREVLIICTLRAIPLNDLQSDTKA